MEHIEFMKRTDSRHLQTHIKFKIQEAFQERDNELDKKKARLQMMLATEDLQQEEEMANLFRARILENMQKRLDWIATAKFERTEAEREFLKLKQIQRELENCEEMRPKESRKITVETKRMQLMQIAEKRGLQMKEKEIEKIWFDAAMCLEREKEKQHQYENHLKKIIAEKAVLVLDGQLDHLKYVKELQNEEKREEQLKIEQSKAEDALRIDFEVRHKLEEKNKEGARRRDHLNSTNAERALRAKQLQFSEAKNIEIQTIQLRKEEELLKANRDHNRESCKRYLQYDKDKKSEINCRNKTLDTALIACGRRIYSEPIPMIPYQKSVR